MISININFAELDTMFEASNDTADSIARSEPQSPADAVAVDRKRTNKYAKKIAKKMPELKIVDTPANGQNRRVSNEELEKECKRTNLSDVLDELF